jgi:twitching motility protein PilT
LTVPAIHGLFDDLVKRGGSDLHLAVNQPPLARVRGELVVLRDAAIPQKELEELLLEIVTPAQRARLAAELELELGLAYEDVARFRGSYYVKHSGIAATFRLVPLRVPSLAELGCPEILWRLADRRRGLVLVAGPAANGKTTTIAAMVDHVNKTRACHIVTIEHPLEYVHESLRAQITQREVGTHAPSVASALRAAARESTDVVFVSELSTPEEVSLAIDLANDGTLVFAPIVAGGAAAAVERIIAMFPAEGQPRVRNLLADGLCAVMVQHLVRAVDSKSRIAVHEILLANPGVAQLIRDGRTDAFGAAISAGTALGMQSLDAGLDQLVGAGKISLESAFERAIDKEAFARAVGKRLDSSTTD